MNKIMRIVLALSVFLPAGARAEMGKGVRAASIPRQEAEKLRPSAGQAKKMAELAEKYDYPLAEVRGLREKGLAWTEIDHTLALARKLGQSPSDIADLREMGFGWWDISLKLAPEPGTAAGEELAKSDEGRKEDLRDSVREASPTRRIPKDLLRPAP